MNGAIRTFVIKRPLIRPTTAPIASVAATATAIFSGLPFMRMADISTASLMTEPTERSMPPLIMTKVSPIATVPRNAAVRSTLKMLRSVRKFGDNSEA